MPIKRQNAYSYILINLIVLFFFNPAQTWAQAYLNVEAVGLTTNAVVSDINIDGVAPNSGLYLFPFYLRLRFPNDNFTAWGIHTYTNNSLSSLVPTDGVYGGLRGNNLPLERIPLYWQTYDILQSNTITAGALAFRSDTLRYWGLVKDRNDTDVVNTWMDYANLINRTVVGYGGLGPYPQTNRTQNQPPVYVYLGMNVGNVTSQQFRTTLRLDLYNLGISVTQGGYATPNPFTPGTGQRARFNFYLKSYDSRFTIYVYNIRGRLIRTITDRPEWDGRNESGKLVEGGVYIYQIEAEGQRVSGTVVVIK